VREAAAEGVGYVREIRALPALIAMSMPSAPPTLRRRALWSLGLIGGSDAASALAAALARKHFRGRARPRHPGPRTDPSVRRRPRHWARKPHGVGYTVAFAAVKALTAVPGQVAADQLLAACADAPVHEAGLEAARALVLRRILARRLRDQRLREEVDLRQGLDPVAEDLLLLLPLVASESAAASSRRSPRASAPPRCNTGSGRRRNCPDGA